MIIGSFSITGEAISLSDLISSETSYKGLNFHPVIHGGFEGGYFLQDYLPFTRSDLYFYDEKEGLIVLVSGSVYNSTELSYLPNIRKQACDPELIAVMFLHEGPEFVKKLNGDFAIFIGQPGRRQAFLFRDHAGVRPLAYVVTREMLHFSSDITGLSRVMSAGLPPETEYLLGWFKYIDYRQTPCKKVRKLLPGHFLKFSANGAEIVRYWSPEKIRKDNNMKYGQMLSDLKALVSDAIAIRCDLRFTAGAHTSGGLDSGIVSALARKGFLHQENFFGFSWSPAEFIVSKIKYDERDLVQLLCEKSNITPVFSDMTITGFLRHVAGFYDNQGYFFEERTMEQAARTGTNLIFSGWGGDEFISTGDRGIETDLLSGFKLKTYFRRNPVRPLKKFLKYFLQYTLYPALGILQKNISKSFENDARYIRDPFKKSDARAISNFYFHISRRQLHLRLLRFYHLQERCESWAITGYRNGVEYRYPLLDRRIIEFMLKVPSELLCQTDYFRPLLRIIGEGILPEEVLCNTSKQDPVYAAFWNELLKNSAGSLMEETDTWKANQDLSFVDFDLLKADILHYKKNSDKVDFPVLFRALVYIKAIHEFTVAYRNNI